MHLICPYCKARIPAEALGNQSVIECPQCRRRLQRPGARVAPPPSPPSNAPPHPAAQRLEANTHAFRPEKGAEFDRTLLVYVGGAMAIVYAFIVYGLSSTLRQAAIVFAGSIIAMIATAALRLFHAKATAIARGERERSIFFGYVKMVFWNPNEGLILLRNKSISDVIHGSGGGIKLIFPILGEQVGARAPLSLQLTHFEDDSILTRESVHVRMKVAIWWSISDLVKYYFLISEGVHSLNDDARHEHRDLEHYDRRDTAEAWLQALTEGSLRKLVSTANTAALVSASSSRYLSFEAGEPAGANSVATELAPDMISRTLQKELATKAANYGLAIDRVEIQDLGLAPEIQEAITKVWTASLKPAQSEAEARARQIELQGVASVLGVEATALNEVAKNFSHASFIGGMPQIIGALLGDKAARRTASAGPPAPNTANASDRLPPLPPRK